MNEWWSSEGYQEFAEDLLRNTPDSWDGDEGQESIILAYVHELEARLLALGGSLERWPDGA